MGMARHLRRRATDTESIVVIVPMVVVVGVGAIVGALSSC